MLLIFWEVIRNKMTPYSGKLSEGQWGKLECVFRQIECDLRFLRKNRSFLDAVLWVILNKTAWCHLPPEFGAWSNVYNRYKNWSRYKLWHALAQKGVDDSELQGMLDQIVESCELFNFGKEHCDQKKSSQETRWIFF